LKVNHLIELARAVKDEEDFILKRKEEMQAKKKLSQAALKTMRRNEKARRHKKRLYLRTLQYNNEVTLMLKMRELGLLW
jgi:hypothetical protein